MQLCCRRWYGYSIVMSDVFVFIPNALGLLLGLFYTWSAANFADKQAHPISLNLAALYFVPNAVCVLCLSQASLDTFVITYSTSLFGTSSFQADLHLACNLRQHYLSC